MAAIIIGQHRNAALAERHRSSLERERGVPVVILSRRNTEGKKSERGHFFYFQIGKKKRKKTKRKEWHVQLNYAVSDGGNLQIQFVLRGPRRATQDQRYDALTAKIGTGKNVRGWTVNVKVWKNISKNGRERTWKPKRGALSERQVWTTARNFIEKGSIEDIPKDDGGNE